MSGNVTDSSGKFMSSSNIQNDDQDDLGLGTLRTLSLDDRYMNGEFDDDEEDDDDFYPTNPSGSVLMAALQPYNKLEKIREANLLLEQSLDSGDDDMDRKSSSKVNFAEKKTIFVYNGETYSFEACVFPSERFDSKDLTPLAIRSKRLSNEYVVNKRGNETKVLIVKVPNADSEELMSSFTDEFENDDVCIPICNSINTHELKNIGNEVQEQVIADDLQENISEELTIENNNNMVEEIVSKIENNCGVVIKITSAEDIELDVNQVHEENQSDDEKLEQIEYVKICNNSQDNKNNELQNVKEDFEILNKPVTHQISSNKKNCFIKSKEKGTMCIEKHIKNFKKSLNQTVSGKKTDPLKKSKIVVQKLKSIDIDITPNCSGCSSHAKVERPKSCTEKSKSEKRLKRPFTAPVHRSCCQWNQPRLPEYNGLRSEYGLSADQLRERKLNKIETNKARQMKKENKLKEKEEKRKENEAKFCAWLENKKKQAHNRYLRNQHMFLEASSITTYPAPTSHLKKMGTLRRNKITKNHRNCISLEEILMNAKPHEGNTYRIYLGVTVD